jgi:glycosyltransferase involved in cell wall biosynthesis
LQQKMLEQADAVVAVNQQQTDILASHVPSQKSKFLVVPNGVDMEDFDHLDPAEVHERRHGPPDRFVLTFTGQFTSRRVNDALFDGLGSFAKWVARQKSGFELRVVGVISCEMRERFVAAGVPLAATGFLPHDQAIEHMVSADALLLLTPTGHHGSTLSTGKVYEYLAAGRPILLIGPQDSVARELVTGFNAGICAVPNRDEIIAALKQLFDEWNRGARPPACHHTQLRPFTRKHLTGQLAKILNKVRTTN